MHLNKGYQGKKDRFITKVNHIIVHLPPNIHLGHSNGKFVTILNFQLTYGFLCISSKSV
jgi:hypothetical protein